MDLRPCILYFLCMLTLSTAAETGRGFSASDYVKKQSVTSNNSKEEIQYAFHKRNDTATLELPPLNSNTKWSPWTPIPNANSMKNSSLFRYNLTSASLKNTTKIYKLENLTKSNSSSISNDSSEWFWFGEDGKSMSSYNKNQASFSKGLTHYLWNTVYIFFRCFRDHWTNGVIDCVTARATTLIDSLLGLGIHQAKDSGFFSYDDDFEESPRNDITDLALGDDDEDDEDDEEDDVSDETGLLKDAREGDDEEHGEHGDDHGHGGHHGGDDEDYDMARKKKKKQRKYLRKLRMIIIGIMAAMLPILTAVKLKFFIMMSLGIGLLGMLVGKTVMFSMLALPAAVYGAYKRESHNFVKKVDAIVTPPLTKFSHGIDPFSGGRLLPDVF